MPYIIGAIIGALVLSAWKRRRGGCGCEGGSEAAEPLAPAPQLESERGAT